MELKTTANLYDQRIILDYIFPLDYVDEKHFINFKCINISSSTWIYDIRGCMKSLWTPYRYMNGVPSDEIKVWQITRTSTSLVVVCNGVIVLNFNFLTDYKDGYSSCYESWTRESDFIFLNSADGPYGQLQMRIIHLSKHWINVFIIIPWSLTRIIFVSLWRIRAKNLYLFSWHWKSVENLNDQNSLSNLQHTGYYLEESRDNPDTTSEPRRYYPALLSDRIQSSW